MPPVAAHCRAVPDSTSMTRGATRRASGDAAAPDVGLMDGRKRRVAVIEKNTDADRRSTQLDPLDCVLVQVG
jgi:hypothetical protein